MFIRSKSAAIVARHTNSSTRAPRPGLHRGQLLDTAGSISWLTHLPRQLHERLGVRELTRRIWHMAPGLCPILWWFLPHGDPLSLPELCLLTLVAVGLPVATCCWYSTISRPGDQDSVAAAFGYASAPMLSVLLFPSRAEMAVTVFAVIAFGDGSATLGGLFVKGRELPWNPKKTWAGSLCFLLVAAPLSSLYYFMEARPGVSWQVALLCGLMATLGGAIAESVPSRINDNIRVGFVALGVLAGLQAILNRG